VANLIAAELNLLPELAVLVVAYCVMANHVHLLVRLPETSDFNAARMMQRLKGRTAMAANRLLGRQGQAFWRHESYDHVVRDGWEQEWVVAYILNNPVKAGLVSEWTDWPCSFLM